jgi:hypothetical protein
MVLFSNGRHAIVGHFALAATDFFRFFREWLQRDRLRVIKLTTDRLIERHLQGVPETDPYGSLLRKYLCNAGGQQALLDLDMKKATLSSLMHAFGPQLTPDMVSITERDGVLVFSVTLPDLDPDFVEGHEEPAPLTDDPEAELIPGPDELDRCSPAA